MKRPNLQARGRYWQEVLGLQGWLIEFRWCHPGEIDDDSTGISHGEVAADSKHHHALIKVLAPEYRLPNPVPDADPLYIDWEVTLVHELLHVSLSLQDQAVPSHIDTPGSMFWLGQEQHINAVAKALVTLDREGTA